MGIEKKYTFEELENFYKLYESSLFSFKIIEGNKGDDFLRGSFPSFLVEDLKQLPLDILKFFRLKYSPKKLEKMINKARQYQYVQKKYNLGIKETGKQNKTILSKLNNMIDKKRKKELIGALSISESQAECGDLSLIEDL